MPDAPRFPLDRRGTHAEGVWMGPGKGRLLMLPVAIQVAVKVAQAIEALGVPYMVGGSIASSTYGTPRSTQDVDLVAALRLEHVPQLVTSLEAEFYVDGDMIRDAIHQRSSFNVLHLSTAYKVDVFVLKSGLWAREEMARRRQERIGVEPDVASLYFSSPEDTLLHKLEWYRA